ncbi:DUF5107 domain-containing protein [Neobacillus drentensis]|uniref:DUF5107 domain-containing protein n=1 Tax=Neobacillus drentensis TaxID=220684 RepID=UPI002FFEA8B7
MMNLTETEELLLFHPIQSAGPIPTISDPDGVYPYESFVETSERPSLIKVKMVTMENSSLKVKICPDLGGKVFSLFDKTSDKEILYDSGSVKPVRILPRMAFLSGGIEVSFPISHTPVQIESVQFKAEIINNRIYFWCGEKEVRYGMQWTIEFSLGEFDHFLTQRSSFYNPTSKSHAWMSWSNAALPVRNDTELYFPDGDVLYHGHEMKTIRWNSEESTRLRNFDHMAGFFWESAATNAFGVFTPSLGTGLYHISNKKEVPGIKLWTYGIGKDEKWAYNTSLKKESYVEIQAGPIKDQSIKEELAPGEEKVYCEYWFPVSKACKINEMTIPTVHLISQEEIPRFNWTRRAKVIPWVELLHAFDKETPNELPVPPEPNDNSWPPTGMFELEHALIWAMKHSDAYKSDLWNFYLGVWYAGNERYDEGLRILSDVGNDFARIVEARIYLRNKKLPLECIKALSKIKIPSLALHPQVIIERDLALELMGEEQLDERNYWLEQLNALNDEELIERRCQLLFDQKRYIEAKELLESTTFSLVHQRYSRTNLWNLINEKLGGGMSDPLPATLGEDQLAKFGQYRIFDDQE